MSNVLLVHHIRDLTLHADQDGWGEEPEPYFVENDIYIRYDRQRDSTRETEVIISVSKYMTTGI